MKIYIDSKNKDEKYKNQPIVIHSIPTKRIPSPNKNNNIDPMRTKLPPLSLNPISNKNNQSKNQTIEKVTEIIPNEESIISNAPMFTINDQDIVKKNDTEVAFINSAKNQSSEQNNQNSTLQVIQQKFGRKKIILEIVFKILVIVFLTGYTALTVLTFLKGNANERNIQSIQSNLAKIGNAIKISEDLITINRQTEFISEINERNLDSSQKTVLNSEGMYINDSNGVQQVKISASENIEIAGQYSQSLKEIIIKDENGREKLILQGSGISLYDIPITFYDSSDLQILQISTTGIEAEDVVIDIEGNSKSVYITSELIELKNGNIELIDTSQLPVITISQSTGLQMFNGLDIQLEEGNIETTGGNIGTEDGNIYSSEGNIYSTLGDLYTEQGTIYTLNGDISAKLGNYYLLDSVDTSIIELTQNEIIMYDSSANELFKLSQTDGFKVTGQDFVLEEGNLYVTEVGGGIFVELTFDDMALMDGTGEYNILLSRSSGIEVFSSKNVAVYGGGVYVRDTSSNNMIEITQTSIILESSSTQYITISRSSGITVDQSLNVKIYGGYVLLQNSAYSKLTQNSLTFFSNGGSSLITISNSVGISLQSSLNLFVDGGNIYVRTDSGSNLIELTQNAIILEDENSLVFTSITRTNGIQIMQSLNVFITGGNLYLRSEEGLNTVEMTQVGIFLVDEIDSYISITHEFGICVYLERNIITWGGEIVVKDSLGYDFIELTQTAILVVDSDTTHISLSSNDGIEIYEELPIYIKGGGIYIKNLDGEDVYDFGQTEINFAQGVDKYFTFSFTEGFSIFDETSITLKGGHIYIKKLDETERIDIGPDGIFILDGGVYYISLLQDSGITLYDHDILVSGGAIDIGHSTGDAIISLSAAYGILISEALDIITQGSFKGMDSSYVNRVIAGCNYGFRVMDGGGNEIAYLDENGNLLSNINCGRFGSELSTCSSNMNSYLNGYMSSYPFP